MRYYLDTQTLAQYFFSLEPDCCRVRDIFEDYGNTFLTSGVCVMELIHLIQSDRIRPLKGRDPYDVTKVIETMTRAGVDIVPANAFHLQRLSQLPLFPEHNDPNDRLIIAQAVADRIPLISSDLKFRLYADCGLELVENR